MACPDESTVSVKKIDSAKPNPNQFLVHIVDRSSWNNRLGQKGGQANRSDVLEKPLVWGLRFCISPLSSGQRPTVYGMPSLGFCHS